MHWPQMSNYRHALHVTGIATLSSALDKIPTYTACLSAFAVMQLQPLLMAQQTSWLMHHNFIAALSLLQKQNACRACIYRLWWVDSSVAKRNCPMARMQSICRHRALSFAKEHLAHRYNFYICSMCMYRHEFLQLAYIYMQLCMDNQDSANLHGIFKEFLYCCMAISNGAICRGMVAFCPCMHAWCSYLIALG